MTTATISAAADPILAIDLGKYKRVACLNHSAQDHRFHSFPTSRQAIGRLLHQHRPAGVRHGGVSGAWGRGAPQSPGWQRPGGRPLDRCWAPPSCGRRRDELLPRHSFAKSQSGSRARCFTRRRQRSPFGVRLLTLEAI